ncbi:hypothetical protein SARC_08105 [Sphaeroforma arctica JP610]|uniref:Uncharacterized protein n=1 Tax=Sphaeroforma arctica JP610 TaxID=667725 RepID=A0A0L0FS19_9EUKA|nr:hypothetical protein SARC_08105 [Sphaeroforma arctica JP610]KNC79499.1 hypothetical protein SARC_08105 [Sphaeroforma arctica JP610]|eukprot:XP_014153401.1 hypothetical protein SARC_08105 [Sphaeroforma arctica JP610]
MAYMPFESSLEILERDLKAYMRCDTGASEKETNKDGQRKRTQTDKVVEHESRKGSSTSKRRRKNGTTSVTVDTKAGNVKRRRPEERTSGTLGIFNKGLRAPFVSRIKGGESRSLRDAFSEAQFYHRDKTRYAKPTQHVHRHTAKHKPPIRRESRHNPKCIVSPESSHSSASIDSGNDAANICKHESTRTNATQTSQYSTTMKGKRRDSPVVSTPSEYDDDEKPEKNLTFAVPQARVQQAGFTPSPIPVPSEAEMHTAVLREIKRVAALWKVINPRCDYVSTRIKRISEQIDTSVLLREPMSSQTVHNREKNSSNRHNRHNDDIECHAHDTGSIQHNTGGLLLTTLGSSAGTRTHTHTHGHGPVSDVANIHTHQDDQSSHGHSHKVYGPVSHLPQYSIARLVTNAQNTGGRTHGSRQYTHAHSLGQYKLVVGNNQYQQPSKDSISAYKHTSKDIFQEMCVSNQPRMHEGKIGETTRDRHTIHPMHSLRPGVSAPSQARAHQADISINGEVSGSTERPAYTFKNANDYGRSGTLGMDSLQMPLDMQQLERGSLYQERRWDHSPQRTSHRLNECGLPSHETSMNNLLVPITRNEKGPPDDFDRLLTEDFDSVAENGQPHSRHQVDKHQKHQHLEGAPNAVTLGLGTLNFKSAHEERLRHGLVHGNDIVLDGFVGPTMYP